MNVMHSSRSDLWYTPNHIICLAKEVMGSITLDPASDSVANEVVGANDIYTVEDDGMSKEFYGNVWLNPPGGKVGKSSKVGLFWSKLMDERPNISQAIFMGFSLECLQVTQKYSELSVGDFPICIPKKRLRFNNPLVPNANAPAHSNVIAYIPGTVDNTIKFIEVFKQLGVTR